MNQAKRTEYALPVVTVENYKVNRDELGNSSKDGLEQFTEALCARYASDNKFKVHVSLRGNEEGDNDVHVAIDGDFAMPMGLSSDIGNLGHRPSVKQALDALPVHRFEGGNNTHVAHCALKHLQTAKSINPEVSVPDLVALVHPNTELYEMFKEESKDFSSLNLVSAPELEPRFSLQYEDVMPQNGESYQRTIMLNTPHSIEDVRQVMHRFVFRTLHPRVLLQNHIHDLNGAIKIYLPTSSEVEHMNPRHRLRVNCREFARLCERERVIMPDYWYVPSEKPGPGYYLLKPAMTDNGEVDTDALEALNSVSEQLWHTYEEGPPMRGVSHITTPKYGALYVNQLGDDKLVGLQTTHLSEDGEEEMLNMLNDPNISSKSAKTTTGVGDSMTSTFVLKSVAQDIMKSIDETTYLGLNYEKRLLAGLYFAELWGRAVASIVSKSPDPDLRNIAPERLKPIMLSVAREALAFAAQTSEVNNEVQQFTSKWGSHVGVFKMRSANDKQTF